MDEYSQIELRDISLSMPSELRKVDKLLEKCSLRRDFLEYMAGLYDYNTLIGCAGFDGSTIKCAAVDESYRGEGLLNTLISHLQEMLIKRGVRNIKVFTVPENEDLFAGAGFRVVEKSEKVMLMESGHPGIREYINSLARERRSGLNGAIVMNCNPFTNGHRYLVEYASKMCDWLNIFIVREDKSLFPFDVRMKLIKEGLADIKNIVIRDGGDYIISSATFPSYFLKEYSAITKAHAMLDISIFAKYIAPSLGITRRFVGEEPFDPVTSEYNDAMREIFPKRGMEKPYIIERMHSGNEIISASRVRKLLALGQFDKVMMYVPDTTYEFLISDQAKPIIAKIRESIA